MGASIQPGEYYFLGIYQGEVQHELSANICRSDISAAATVKLLVSVIKHASRVIIFWLIN